jgi:hypothetical protein
MSQSDKPDVCLPAEAYANRQNYTETAQQETNCREDPAKAPVTDDWQEYLDIN